MLPPVFGHGIQSYMNMTFELDGQFVGLFEFTPTTDKWSYNFPIFSKNELENVQHTLVVSPQSGKGGSYLVFDYMTYE